MDAKLDRGKANFGTAPVFLTAISTILGAIMFLRFGYAVGNVGFLGTLTIILIGHAVTIPTAMALAEIATNQKVEGGGEYYIISRSFGIIPGASIGIALFLSQAISVAFYVIAFAEAFRPVFAWIHGQFGIQISDPRVVSLPAVLVLGTVVIWKGANVGIKLLYGVVATLFLSLVLFFVGSTDYAASMSYETLIHTVQDPAGFFLVFAICFPAFTGMTAGVGLSGDLRDPRKSIPLGTLSATLIGMVIYVAIAYKLAISASPGDLVGDQLIMSRIAIWGPIIPIGLACATLSSAVGSALVAPRTLQALALDRIFPSRAVGDFLSRGKGPTSEPADATKVVFGIAIVFVALGDVNFVAQIISMFFMVTYGSICLISFLEHFAADPSYRPSFKSRWYVSLFGALACLWLMFKMSTPYAIISIVVMGLLYLGISYSQADRRGLASIFRGAIFQMSRQLQVFLQKSSRRAEDDRWRPSVVCISRATFERLDAFNLLRWIAHRYGFGTYIHLIEDYLSRASVDKSREAMARLVRLTDISHSNIYVDTLISPSYTTAVASVAQLPGISGQENNLVLFEFSREDPTELDEIIDNYKLVASTGFDFCILSSSDRNCGYHSEIHIWITAEDYENATLMILLGYIVLGHPDWKEASIKLMALFPDEEIEAQRERLLSLIVSGRLPISAKNVVLMEKQPDQSRRQLIAEHSRDADLIILGFVGKALLHQKEKLFEGYEGLANILFVNTTREIRIQRDAEAEVKQEGAEEADDASTVEVEADSGSEVVPDPAPDAGTEDEEGGNEVRPVETPKGGNSTPKLPQ